MCLGASALMAACSARVVRLAGDDAGVDGAVMAPPDVVVMTPPDAVVMAPPDVVVMAPDVVMTPPDAALRPDVVGTPADARTGDPTGAGSVDLLVVLDNSASMVHGQQYANYISWATSWLLSEGRARDLHFAVVTSDLGTPGSMVPNCTVSEGGDNGIMNPRQYGPATHLRASSLTTIPVFCDDALTRSPFETLFATDDAMYLYWAPSCHMTVDTGGCGLEQQLEAAYRALTVQGAPGGVNAGFLRRDAVLAVLVVSDEDDGSVRDCRYHDGVGTCEDARDVYSVESSRWASSDLNLRMYDYAPGSAQDPTWSLDRYVDPSRPGRGFLGLKPGHPERVVFGAITGVPLAVPQRADGTTDWDTLLGPTAVGRPDDFTQRDGQRAYTDPMDPSGPTSMRQRDPDPLCAQRMVPACRLRGSPPSMSCTASVQPFAWRARRIAEVARRLDQSALCDGAPCGNGMVSSICEVGDSDPFLRFAHLIARRVVR